MLSAWSGGDRRCVSTSTCPTTGPALKPGAQRPAEAPRSTEPTIELSSTFYSTSTQVRHQKPGEVSLNITTFTRNLVRRRPGRVPGGRVNASALRNSHKVHHSRDAGGEVGSSKRLIHFHTPAVRALIPLREPKLRQQAAAARPDTLIKNGC